MAKTTLVGFCFLGALGLFLYAAMTVQGVNPWGPPPSYLTAVFSSVAGLSLGDHVRVRGFQVGVVDQLQYTDDGIVVVMRMDKEIPPRDGYRFTVMPSSALGGNFVDYVPGEGSALPPKTTLQGNGTADLLSSAGQWFEENSRKITEIIDDIRAVSDRLEQGTGVIGRLVSHEETMRKFDDIVESIRSATEKIDRGDNLIGVLLNDPDQGKRLDSIIANVEEIARKANSGEGVLGALLNDGEIAASVRTIVANLEASTDDIRQQRGFLGRLISDPQFGKEIDSILANIDSFTGAIANGPGTVHDLLYDDGLRNQARSIFADIAAATRQLGPEGEGTMAQLLHGRELAADIQGTVTLLRESVEDTRELAPLNTFLSILFSAF
ncbi:MAG: MCE family protein [Planctomycetes bacterium]|nr:MCE family protein [Planctomycetota bacterium]